MKRLLALLVCVIFAFPIACGAEGINLSAIPQDEPTMVKTAVQLLKNKWLEDYQNNRQRTESGYFEIAHTQIVYINPEVATRELTGDRNDYFHNIYCIVDFVLLVDLAVYPYHVSAETWRGANTVIVYLNGTMEATDSLILKGLQRYILNEQTMSQYISSISNLGSEYNEIVYLLEAP